MARKFTDPHYDAIEAKLEREFNLPAGGMKALRTRGERSNEDQVSSASARTVYQIIPGTRSAFLKTYGVDAYADDDGRSAARVAALHLRDDMKKYGSWDAAVTRYIGGPDPSKWGKQTMAYLRRVTGRNAPTAGDGYTTPETPAEPIKDFTGDWLNSRPADPSTARPLPVHVAKETREEKRQRLNMAVHGSANPTDPDTVDDRDVGATEVRDNQRAAVEQAIEDKKITPWQRLKASWHDNSLTASILRNLDRENHDPEPGHVDYYMKNRMEIEDGYDADERSWLRESTGLEDLNRIRGEIAETRKRRELYTGRGVSSTDSVLFGLVGGVVDPAGIAAGEGVGGLLRFGGVGAKTLYTARRPVLGTLSQAGEFAVGNVAVTALMDAEGDYMTSNDYAMSASIGAALGTAAAPFHIKRGKAKDTGVQDLFAEQADNARTQQEALLDRAEADAGPNATADDVAATAQRLDEQDHRDLVSVALADQPDELKLMSADRVVTQDADRFSQVERQYGLDNLSDDAERKAAVEITARSADIVRANPIDTDRLNPATRLGGMESTGITLLRSNSVVLRAIGITLLEGTTGAAGRRRTAALAQHTRERVYNSELAGYMDRYHLYRKEQGAGIISEAWNGEKFKQFERDVFLEIERRGDDTGYVPHSNPIIREAADMVERGFDKMRVEQQHVQTVGNARLGEHSRGYVPHRIDGRKLAVLADTKPNTLRAIRSIYSKQFQASENGFDKKFADKLAKKYVEQAIRRAKQGYDVPMNLHTSEAADMVQDALKAMNLDPAELEKLMGKFSRGGAGHTKKRLRLNLDEDIGDGMKLVDLYDTSVSNLYRGYSRRVSGEVALAQFGIMGKKGLDLARVAAETTGATREDLRAFDQVAAEFLNTPYGEHNHQWMDNVRIATSLSRLGGMGFTQLGEYGNGIAALGAQRVFSSMMDAGRLLAEVRAVHTGNATPNPILQSLDQLGGTVGSDEFVNTRLFDVPDNSIQMYGNEQVGVVSRFLRAGANIQAVVSGHRHILGVQVRGMSEQIVRKAMDYVKSGKEDVALDDMGINTELRARLRANMDRVATFKGNKLQSLDLMAGDLTGHEIMSIRDAIERGASQIIQRTYIGETGKWAHDGFLKLLTQFRTFGITAIEKQWGRNKGNYGMVRSVAYLFGAMSFAAPIYMARMQTKMIGMEEAEAEEYADKHLTPLAIGVATLNYASASGLSSDILDLGFGFAGGPLGYELPEDVAARGQSRGGFVGGQIAPGVGLINDIHQGTVGGNYKKLGKAMPGANLPFIQPAVNVLGDD